MKNHSIWRDKGNSDLMDEKPPVFGEIKEIVILWMKKLLPFI